MPDSAVDLVGGTRVTLRGGLSLAPYQMVWLRLAG
jgi:hypothetical protein